MDHQFTEAFDFTIDRHVIVEYTVEVKGRWVSRCSQNMDGIGVDLSLDGVDSEDGPEHFDEYSHAERIASLLVDSVVIETMTVADTFRRPICAGASFDQHTDKLQMYKAFDAWQKGIETDGAT